MKKALPILALCCIAPALAAAPPSAQESGDTEKTAKPTMDLLEFTGQVVETGVEGGFYGILSCNSGGKYKPVNLPEEYHQAGLKLKVKARLLPRRMGFHMWGSYIEIIETIPTSCLAEEETIEDNCTSLGRGG